MRCDRVTSKLPEKNENVDGTACADLLALRGQKFDQNRPLCYVVISFFSFINGWPSKILSLLCYEVLCIFFCERICSISFWQHCEVIWQHSFPVVKYSMAMVLGSPKNGTTGNYNIALCITLHEVWGNTVPLTGSLTLEKDNLRFHNAFGQWPWIFGLWERCKVYTPESDTPTSFCSKLKAFFLFKEG